MMDSCRCAPTEAGLLPRPRMAAVFIEPVMKCTAAAAIPPAMSANSRNPVTNCSQGSVNTKKLASNPK